MALTRPRYSQIYDTDYKQSVTVATTGDVGNVYAVGAQTNSIDGVTLSYLDRILVKDQTDSKQNGIYEVLVVGTGSNGTWRRSLDTNSDDKVTSGLRTSVSAGSVNIGKEFRLVTADPITVGVTGLVFSDVAANPTGGNTQIQFNDAGVMGAIPWFTFNKTGNVLGISGNITALSGTADGNIGLVPKGIGFVRVFGTNGLVIPRGTSAQQSPQETGAIRFNTDTSQFEGYGGTNWSSLGGVRSVDGLTFITAELTSGASDDILHFYASNNTNAVEVARLNTANLLVNISTPSTSTTTGAFNVLGGVGIGGNLYAAPNAAAVFGAGIAAGTANVYITGGTSQLTVTTQAYRIFADATYPRWGIGSAANAYSFFNIWPVNNRNYIESGSRPLSIGFAGGAGGNVLYMDPVTGTTVLTLTTEATSPTTGALVVTGGVGIGGNLYVGSTQQATSTSTGALVVSGGASIGKDLWIGGNLYVANVNSLSYSYLQLNDPLVYLTSNVTFPYNYSIGFYSQYTGGPANVYAHTGFVRSPDDNRWHLVSNVSEPGGGNLNVYDTNVIYDTMVVGNLISKNRISIGTDTLSDSLSIYSNTSSSTLGVSGDGQGSVIYAARYSNDTTGPNNNLRKYRGTLASPLPVQASDILGSYRFNGWGGATVRILSRIDSVVEQYTSDTDMSAYLMFATTNNSTSGTERLRITGSGNVLIGVSNPNSSGNTTIGYTTPSTSTTTGALVVNGGAGIQGNLNVGGDVKFAGNAVHADSGDPVGYTRYLDDVADRFDGLNKKFLITYDDGIVYDVNNPLQLQVFVGGIPVPPARYIRDYFNLSEVAVFDHGFYLQKGLDDANAVVISTVATSTGNVQVSSGGNTIVFATAPSSSMDFQAFVRTNSDPQPAFKFKQTPFTALNIMLGP